ncbi:hypothetical protein PBS_40400 [Paraburkholderia sp. 2C]
MAVRCFRATMRALRLGEITRRRELNRWRRDGWLLAHSEQRERLLHMRVLAALISALRPATRCRAVRLRRLH